MLEYFLGGGGGGGGSRSGGGGGGDGSYVREASSPEPSFLQMGDQVGRDNERPDGVEQEEGRGNPEAQGEEVGEGVD